MAANPNALDFDAGGADIRLGLIALATDMTTEDGFAAALRGHPVRFHTTRVLNINPLTEENLRRMGPQLAACAERLLPGMPLDAIAYSCTSGSVALGEDAVAAQIAAGRPGTPVVTPISGAMGAFAALRLRRIALLTPYPTAVGQSVASYFESRGLTIVKQTHLGIESDVDMPFLTLDSLRTAAVAADHPEADGLFISCTALRAMEILDDLEATLEKPCLSSIQCLLWHALSVAGYARPVEGFGALLRAPRGADAAAQPVGQTL